jgi:uncharacterized protein (UPF0210 family)
MLAGASGGDPVKYALTLERAAKDVGVNFIGGFSALVHKGFSPGDRELIEAIPRALAATELVCSSVNVGSTRSGINMDAVKTMGRIIRETAELTAANHCIGAAKLVVFCNAPEDNPFMAGAFHGPGEPDCVINVGVSGPGVVRAALKKAGPACDLTQVADIIKRTAFKITRMDSWWKRGVKMSRSALRHCRTCPLRRRPPRRFGGAYTGRDRVERAEPTARRSPCHAQ